MEVFAVEEFGRALLDPGGAGERLARRTVAIATGNGELSITCLMVSPSLWGADGERACATDAARPVRRARGMREDATLLSN